MLKFEILSGKDIDNYIATIAQFRINYFQVYPYLYKGDWEYEMNYLKGLSTSKHSLIVLASEEKSNEVVGILTCLPLKGESDILRSFNSEEALIKIDAEEYYYIGEIIIRPEYRNKGIGKKLYFLAEDMAFKWGFKKACLLTVDREKDDRRRPANYHDSNHFFQNLGHINTGIKVIYEWPTFLEDGTISNQSHQMSFWTKKLER